MTDDLEMTDWPKRDEHPDSTCGDHCTEGPTGYSARHEWFRVKAKTHKQRRCAECGLWSIWIPRGETRTPQNRTLRTGGLKLNADCVEPSQTTHPTGAAMKETTDDRVTIDEDSWTRDDDGTWLADRDCERFAGDAHHSSQKAAMLDEIVRLREALKPFAATAGAFDGFGDDFVAYIDTSPSVDWLTAKDFRNAAKALEVPKCDDREDT